MFNNILLVMLSSNISPIVNGKKVIVNGKKVIVNGKKVIVRCFFSPYTLITVARKVFKSI
jgi:hypothetical protein